MIRLFAVFANLLIALVLSVFFADPIEVKLNVPNEVTAGTEFEVHVTINKGELESFSRLLQTMPAGLTAVSSESSNADFSFENKRARFIWLRMPDEKQFEVSYTIKVDQRLKGDFNIGSKFSYINENERRTVTAESNSITILPSPDIEPELIVDISDFERLVIPYIAPSGVEPQIACIRQTPIKSPDGDGYIVNLLVSKERKEKFAKIEEIIPKGFKAVPLQDRDAIFTYRNNVAKFLWMNLPASSFFVVSYKLVPIGLKNTSIAPIDGQFSYLEEAKTVSINIQQTGEDLALVKTPEELNQLILGLGTATLASVDADGVSKTVKVKTPRSNKKYMLEPEEGIYYRVQLAAGHSPVNIRRYFRKYKLEKEVRQEFHEGWQKYSVGSFPEYKNARDYRMHIWNTTNIDDAFVSAYNNGNRITVQEALMIANQKWYK
jgi:hypothetical protein